MCCKALEIQGLSDVDTWCKHCDIGIGCKVHTELKTVSPSCDTFDCVWRIEDGPMPEELRPDKTKIVVTTPVGGDTTYADFIFHVPPTRQDSWKKGLFGKWMTAFLEIGGGAIIRIGDRRIAVGRSALSVQNALDQKLG